MRTIPLLLVTIGIITGGVARAQSHSDGYVVVGTPGQVFAITNGGAATSIQFGTAAIYATAMNADNRTALVFDSTINSILTVDPKTLAVVGTFFTSTSLTAAASVYDMCFDHHGDLFIASATTTPGRGVFRIDRAGVMSPVTLASTSTQPFYAPENLDIDVDSGELLVGDDANGDVLRVLRRDGTGDTTIASGWNFRYGTHRDMNTGTIYSGTCCDTSTPNRSIYHLPLTATTPGPFFSSTMLRGGYDPMIDRASMASPRLVCASWDSGSNGGLWRLDIGSLALNRVAQLNGNTYDVAFTFGRNLQSIRTARGKWSVRLNVPADAGKVFAIAMNLSGPRPGFPLPDGRRVPLVIDTIAAASIGGRLPFFTGNLGVLNASGTAVATLDLSFLPPAANGIVAWFGAATLDPNAPTGIATIVDTKVFVVEGL